MAPPTIPVEQRFAQKYEVDPKTGCWLWTAARMHNGYAQFRWSAAKNGYGHRFAYEHFVGPVPEKHQLHHICEVRHCVNPEHLVAVLPKKHQLELSPASPAYQNARKTHCKRGHPLSGENLHVYNGHRRCQTCYRAWKETHRDLLREYGRAYYSKHRKRLAARRLELYHEQKGAERTPPPSV